VLLFAIIGLAPVSFGHGDVTPQAVDTTGLKPLGKEWLEENPYTFEKAPDQMKKAIEIGCSAYNSNCARCHGLGVVSGGLAPDLRYLEEDASGDEWFINRIRKGYHQNGITKMPGFESLMSQEAMWAIRAYTNIRPDDDEKAAVKGTGGSCQTMDFEMVKKIELSGEDD
jgi:cytochrome c-550 PedF